jgi:hypothetical protein
VGGRSIASIVSAVALMRMEKLKMLQELHGYNGQRAIAFVTL